MKQKRQISKARGFTLVELLVVIAIMAVLAGLTIVVVGWARQRGDVAKCTTNMKNIYDALTLMKTEGVNTGHHPPGTYPPYEGSLQDGRKSEFIWWDLVADNLGFADRDGSDYRWDKHYSETQLQNPISKKQLGEGKKERDSLIDEPELSFGGYAYNANLGDAVYENERADRIIVIRDNAIDDTASTIYFAESADTREEDDETPGWLFTKVENAPQGNYKDSVHCCMVGGNIVLIKNTDLKDPKIFAFYTQLGQKNYSDQP